MKRLLTLAAAALLAFGATALASERLGGVGEFLEALDQVRSDLKNGVPKPLSEREWRLYDEAEATMRQLLEGRDSIDELDADQQVALFNAQERLEGILKGAEDERVVCRRERRTGSNIRKATCVTVAQLREEQEAAKKVLSQIIHTNSSFGGSFGGSN